MKEWEIRRLIYLKNNPDPGDIIMTDELEPTLQGKKIVIIQPNEVYGMDFEAEIIGYFLRDWDDVVFYPAKSYAVALIYAKLLQRYLLQLH